MSEVTHQELAGAFRAALGRLSRTMRNRPGKNEFICNCLEIACEAGEISDLACYAARTLIRERLGDTGTLQAWLVERAGLSYAEVYDQDRSQNLGRKAQATRRAWLKSLIKEFGGAA